MPILKRKPKTKESKKTVTPDYVEKSRTKSKGTKPTPTTAPSPASGPKPGVGSGVSKPKPRPGVGTTRPRPGVTTPKPKPDPGVSIPRPRTKTPIARQSDKLDVEKLRQIAHNRSMHGKGQTGEKPSLSKQTPKQVARDFFGKKITAPVSSVGKKAGSANRVLQKGGPSSTKRTTLPKKQYAVNTGAGTVPASKVKTPSNKTIRKIDKSLKPVVKKSRSSSVKSPAPKRRKF